MCSIEGKKIFLKIQRPPCSVVPEKALATTMPALHQVQIRLPKTWLCSVLHSLGFKFHTSVTLHTTLTSQSPKRHVQPVLRFTVINYHYAQHSWLLENYYYHHSSFFFFFLKGSSILNSSALLDPPIHPHVFIFVSVLYAFDI